MTIADMVRILNAKVLIGGDKLDIPVYTACCSDLMSDVLAFVDEKTVLITGLTNPHVVRTSEMLDLKCLVFARERSRLRISSKVLRSRAWWSLRLS